MPHILTSSELFETELDLEVEYEADNEGVELKKVNVFVAGFPINIVKQLTPYQYGRIIDMLTVEPEEATIEDDE